MATISLVSSNTSPGPSRSASHIRAMAGRPVTGSS